MHDNHLKFDDVAMLGSFGTVNMLLKNTSQVNSENVLLVTILPISDLMLMLRNEITWFLMQR